MVHFFCFSGGNSISSPTQVVSRSNNQLPTSPTHMAAMRGASQMRQHQQPFDFNQSQFMQGQKGGSHFVYPTPSPDSPGQWSHNTGSPQSEMSEAGGVQSPPGNLYNQQQRVQQQTDGVLI